MINSATIINVDGTHACDINTDIIPLHRFEPTVTQRAILNRQKSQQPGLWPTPTLRDQLEINCEGDIFGNDSADYFTNRQTLLLALFGDPEVPSILSETKLGDLRLNFDGASEDWIQSFTITTFSAPLDGDSPSRTSFQINFVFYDPWFLGVDTGTKYWYA